MNNIAKKLTITWLLLVSGGAFAATPIAELKVIGTLSTPTCEVRISNNGVFDWGALSPSLIKPAAVTPLDEKASILTVVCDAETALTFRPIDNREGSVSQTGESNFGLGMVNGTGKLGFYTVEITAGRVDGVASSVFTTNTGTPSGMGTVFLKKGYRSGWALGSQLTSGKEFVLGMKVKPTLAASKDMNGPITDLANLDGSVTLDFGFGL